MGHPVEIRILRGDVVHGPFTREQVRDLLAKANETKSGDQLAGIAARSERERVAAKLALAEDRKSTRLNSSHRT